jgi:hypothetical protein
MREAVRMTPTRSFTCPVGYGDPVNAHVQAASIAIGVDDESGEQTLSISLRHADGTTLVASLGELASDRFAGLLAAALTGVAPPPLQLVAVHE